MATTPEPELPPVAPAEVSEPLGWFLTGEEVAATKVKLAKIRRRAESKGFNGELEMFATPTTRTHTPPSGLPVTVHGFEVTITGRPPAYEGWRVLAVVDKVGQGPDQESSVIRWVPGAEQSVANSDIKPGQCDHCHTRRPRAATVLVQSEETGQVLQVGKRCLKDFTGWSTMPVFYTDDELAERVSGARGAAPEWSTASVLTYAWAVVEAHGWTSKAAVAGSARHSTADMVELAMAEGLSGKSREQQVELLTSIGPHLEAGQRMAPLITEALLAKMTSETGYEANLCALLNTDKVIRKHLGIAVSAIAAWRRIEGRALADQTRAAAEAERNARLGYAGEVGDQVRLTGTVTTSLRLDGYKWNSPQQAMLVVDCGTSIAKIITTAAWAYEVKLGDTLTVAATVKAHDEYRGAPQTVLLRPKKLDNPPALNSAGKEAEPKWETVKPVSPQARFQETPMAASSPVARTLSV